MSLNKPHETTQTDSAIMDDAYDEHHYDPKSQEAIYTITGTTEVEPDRSKEVTDMAAERRHVQQAVQELANLLNQAGKVVSRVSQASAEVVMRTQVVLANQPAKLLAMNYERSRLWINVNAVAPTANGYYVISTDPNLSTATFNPSTNTWPSNGWVDRAVGNAVFAASTIYVPPMELRTIRDIYMMCSVDSVVSWWEEFVA